MKPNLRKLSLLIATSALIIPLGGCGVDLNEYEIALIVSDSYALGPFDNGYNEMCYDAIKTYGDTLGKTYKYYIPSSTDKNGYVSTMESAISKGAKIIFCAGNNFTDALSEIAPKHQETSFVIIDSEFTTHKNVASVTFSEEEAGYLAGYALAKEGLFDVGFIGGGVTEASGIKYTVDPVIKFGMGYIKGYSEGLVTSKIATVTYGYAYTFIKNEVLTNTIDLWYEKGIQSIFMCGGSITESAIESAKKNPGATVVGVDTNQGVLDECVITSAMKDVARAVTLQLTDYYDGEFKGGENSHYSTKESAIALPLASPYFRFNNFTIAQYQDVYNRLKKGEITFNINTELGKTKQGLEQYAESFHNIHTVWSEISRE